MKAQWNNAVIADAPQQDLIKIEGNWYFPPESIDMNLMKPNYQTTECPWKGTASYYDIKVDSETNDAAAWYYHEPKPGSIERIGKDFTDYIAFWHGVEIVE
jgi:uncharacterized protein (DUF427 family)